MKIQKQLFLPIILLFTMCFVVRGESIDYSNQELTLSVRNRNLAGSDFSGSIVKGNFYNTNLSNANLSGSKFSVELGHANLSGVDLTNVNFTGSWFDSVTQWPEGFDYLNSGANGPGVNYSNREFNLHAQWKNLRGADFSHSIVKGKSYWSFFKANLTEANLQGTDFSGVDLTYTKLNRATYTIFTKWRAGFDPVAKGAILVDSSYGLVAWYPFDGNALDMSGNGNHGTVHGATLVADRHGVAGKAYGFDGTDDRIKIGDAALNGATAYTVSLWAKFGTAQTYQHLLTAANADSDNEFRILSSTGVLVLNFKGPVATGSNLSMADWYTDWKQLVVSRSSTSAPFSVFVDGAFAQSYTATAGAPDIDVNGLWLGADQDSVGGGWEAGQFYSGSLDDVRIYDRALSATEVTELYELEKPVGKNSPTVKAPTFVPAGPGIDYKKKLEEAEARLEELKVLDKKADADIVERRERLVKLEDEISVVDKSLQDANTSLAACEKECETLRANLLAINGAIGVEDARIYGLNGKIVDSEKQLTELENDKSKLAEDLTEAERKASVPHTPGWHFIDDKGWLWTHPDYFPLVYSEQLTGWFYYKPGSQAPWLYYEYNTESWQEW